MLSIEMIEIINFNDLDGDAMFHRTNMERGDNNESDYLATVEWGHIAVWPADGECG